VMMRCFFVQIEMKKQGSAMSALPC